MADSLTTRPSLLLRIRDGRDREAWSEFVRLYAPLVYGFARKRGVTEADADDLVQDVLQQVAMSARQFEYDRARGTFRSWLFKVTRNRVNTFLHADRAYNRGSGDSAVQALLEQQPDGNGDADLWDREYQRRLLSVAAQQVREEFEDASWQAFWQTTYDNQTPGEAAEALGISVGAVYIARSRIRARLAQRVQELQE
jgi:RNA polymerase sigma-70 factor (ECF subfamily)